MAKYKILFIARSHSDDGGAARLLTTLVNNINTHLYNIDIIEILEGREKGKINDSQINKEITLWPPFVKYKNKWTEIAITHILYYRPEIIKYLFKLYNNYDIVIAWDHGPTSFFLNAFKNEVKIAWFQCCIDESFTSESDGNILSKAQLQAWSLAEKIVTVSQKSLQSVIDFFPSLANRTTLIPNCCDFTRIQRLLLENTLLELPPSFNSNIIAGIGRLDKNKNFQLLIRSVSRLIHSGIGCCLLLLGEGEARHELEALVRDEGLTEKVFFAGYQRNPYSYIQKIKILCVTSFSEGFPISVMEAISLGKPFVTTPVAGASEELAWEQRCGLVSDWDVDEYSGCIKRLLTDDALYAAMSENCVLRSRDFSVEKYIENFDKLITQIMKSTPPPPNSAGRTTEQRNYFAEFKARLYFVLSYSLLSHRLWFNVNLQTAYKMLKNRPSAVNMIKFIYRFFRHTVCVILFSPITFAIALIEQFNFGKR